MTNMTKVNEDKLYNYFLNVMNQMPIDDQVKIEILKNNYLTREHDLESSVYILLEGVIITSLVGIDGERERFNLMYMNKPGIVSLVRSENEAIVEQPYDIKVDSERAIFYKINRVKFWQLINNDVLLSQYVKIYYRNRIDANIKQIERILGNRKTGQVAAFLYDCTKLFGERDDVTGEIVINHRITHNTIGEFCGISSRSSVTRIINELVKNGAIEQRDGLFVVKDVEYLKQYTN